MARDGKLDVGNLGGSGAFRGAVPMWDGVRARWGGAGDTLLFEDEQFTLASATPTLTLLHEPLPKSLIVFLNGVAQLDGIDWTRSGQDVTVDAAMGAAAGDVILANYSYQRTDPLPTTALIPDFTSTVLDLSPDAWWRLGSTITDDSSGNGHTLTASGTTPTAAASLTSDTTDGARTWTDPGDGPTGYNLYSPTPSGWANNTDVTVLAVVDPAAGGGVILNRDDDFGHRTFQLRIDTAGEVVVDAVDNSPSLNTYSTSGAGLIGAGPVLVGVRFQVGSLDLLINTSTDTHSGFTGGLYIGANQNIVIGKHVASDPPTDGYNHFNGVLDDILYFTRALSDDEIASIAAAVGV